MFNRHFENGGAAGDGLEFVERAIAFLEEGERLLTPHLYRKIGLASEVLALRVNLIDHPNQTFPQDTNPLDVATLLKKFFSSMPEPLFTFSLYEALVATGASPPSEQEELLRKVVEFVPVENKYMLYTFFRHLKRVAQRSSLNKMQANTLSVIFGPCFLWSLHPSAETLIIDANHIATLIELLISNPTILVSYSDIQYMTAMKKSPRLPPFRPHTKPPSRPTALPPSRPNAPTPQIDPGDITISRSSSVLPRMTPPTPSIETEQPSSRQGDTMSDNESSSESSPVQLEEAVLVPGTPPTGEVSIVGVNLDVIPPPMPALPADSDEVFNPFALPESEVDTTHFTVEENENPIASSDTTHTTLYPVPSPVPPGDLLAEEASSATTQRSATRPRVQLVKTRTIKQMGRTQSAQTSSNNSPHSLPATPNHARESSTLQDLAENYRAHRKTAASKFRLMKTTTTAENYNKGLAEMATHVTKGKYKKLSGSVVNRSEGAVASPTQDENFTTMGFFNVFLNTAETAVTAQDATQIILWVNEKISGENKLTIEFIHTRFPTILILPITSTLALLQWMDKFASEKPRLVKKVKIVTNRYRALDGQEKAASNLIKMVRKRGLKTLPILIYCGNVDAKVKALAKKPHVHATDNVKQVLDFTAPLFV
eukprot:TRINITY_DN11075_c0_g1_i1.p1 TRINITY_DN11075_c0_g1~~TRINITY_DN11075_c0_g1_i1.p1  ORF type:complete len:698 (-),score=113.49 TRINITY_DN11075_c0_g1_i1:159-2123(-)